MSQDSGARSTPHDRHDPMLVTALAAGDLTGAARDQTIALTHSCVECATLHDDLLALARATAAAPPPIAIRPRDFTLTPADAARLRPAGWRRLMAAVSSRSGASRPLGVGLATLGLVGLLVGNVQLQLGGAASAPIGAPTTVEAGAAPAASAGSARSAADAVVGSYDAASQAPGTVAYPAATAGPSPASGYENYGAAVASGLPREVHTPPLAVTPDKSATSPAAGGDLLSSPDAVASGPFRPLNLLFGAAIVLGIGLLVASALRGRRPV